MKYIACGKNFIAWLASEAFTHQDVARWLGITPTNAGFISFYSDKAKAPFAYGSSSSLNLRAAPLDMSVPLFRGLRPRMSAPFISNRKEWLVSLHLDVAPAAWVQSIGGEFIDSYWYPGIPEKPLDTFLLED